MWLQYLLGISLAQLMFVGYDWYAEHQSWTHASLQVQPLIAVHSPPLILKWEAMSIFGHYLDEEQAYAKAKEARLAIHLVGILSSADSESSVIIIELPDKSQKIYHEGDHLPGGELVKKISKDQVYLLRDGVLEYLFLPEKKLTYEPPGGLLSIEE